MKRLLVIAAGMAALVSGVAHAQTAHPPKESVTAVGRIDIPDEIAPAVVPYLMCMSNAFHPKPANPGGLVQSDMDLAKAAAREACAPVRREAMTKGVAMLEARKLGNGREDREARVEATLREVEAIFSIDLAAVLPPTPGANGAPATPSTSVH